MNILNEKNAEQFRSLAEEISNRVNVDVDFYPDSEAQEPFEDDGNLHVVHAGVRAVFDVGLGQSRSPSVQNQSAKRILRALGLPVSERALA